jgi:hypothetical protein
LHTLLETGSQRLEFVVAFFRKVRFEGVDLLDNRAVAFERLFIGVADNGVLNFFQHIASSGGQGLPAFSRYERTLAN